MLTGQPMLPATTEPLAADQPVPLPAVAVPPAEAPAHADAPATGGVDREVSLGQLALTFLWLGAVPVAGKPSVLLFDELVHRRGWLTREEFIEGQTLARVLPGPKTPNMVAHAIQVLRGPRAAALCIALFALPGLVLMFALTLLVFGAAQPPWLQGALHGLSVGAVALLLVMTVRMLPGVREARLGPASAALAFLLTAALGLDLLLVLLGAGLLSLGFNRPRR